MTQHNFKGAIDNISEPQLQFIHSIIQEHGYGNSEVTFESVGQAGDNYVANVKRIVIEGEKGKLQMIAKLAPTIEPIRQVMNMSILFRAEQMMYTEILPTFVQLQKEAGLPESELLKYAKCYGSQSKEPYEVILLEDLKVSEFVMLDRFKSLSNECVHSVLKNFAILHSMSYVLKRQNPEKYNDINENLVDVFQLMAGHEMMTMFATKLENDTISILEEPAQIDLFRNKITDAFKCGQKLSKADKNSKYNVIVQGDAWTNNIMFKLENDKVTDSILIDYQQSKDYSPVSDICTLIFNCTDYDTRKQHFYDWIDYYHSELDKSLANFNLKANYIYPRDKLDADLKRYGKFMFGLSVMMANVMTKKSEEAQEMMDVMTKTENLAEQVEQITAVSSDDEIKIMFKNKIIGLIKSFTEFGLI